MYAAVLLIHSRDKSEMRRQISLVRILAKNGTLLLRNKSRALGTEWVVL